MDTLGPTVSLNAPASGTLVDGDATRPRIKAASRFSSTLTKVVVPAGKPSLRRIAMRTLPGVTPLIERASGTLIAGLGVAPFFVTLPYGSTPNQILIIEVTDANGNVTTDSAQLVLALSDCTLVFSGIPSSGILNQSDCLPPVVPQSTRK